MVDNFLPAFNMEEEKKWEKKDEQISAIRHNIEKRIHGIQNVTDEDRQIHSDFLERR